MRCAETLTLKQDKIDFVFCYDDVFRKISADMASDFFDSLYLADIEKDLIKYRKKEMDSLNFDMNKLAFRLLRSIDFSAVGTEAKVTTSKIRIEHYETEFSGGRNFFLIGEKRDTLARFFVNEWMR